MGPRRWSRGRAVVIAVMSSRIVALQWGHGDGAVEEKNCKDLTLKLQKLQWGHGDGAVEERHAPGASLHRDVGFNGATAMEPWKSEYVDQSSPYYLSFNGAT